MTSGATRASRRRAPAAGVSRGARASGRAATEPWAACAEFAVAVTRRDDSRARRALARLRRLAPSRTLAEQTALMLMPNAGYPAALEALRLIHATWPGRPRRSREGTPADWRRRGRALCARVYGRVTPRLLRNLRTLHPDMAAWVIEEGYGRVLSRPGMAPCSRELVAVAVLAAGAWERQLVSHLLGAARLAASPAEVQRAVEIGLANGGPIEARVAARAWSVAFEEAHPPRRREAARVDPCRGSP